MDTHKIGAVACLDKDVVQCCYEGVVEFLDNNKKDTVDVDFSLQTP